MKNRLLSDLRDIPFCKSALTDAYKYLAKLKNVCSFYNSAGVTKSYKRLRLSPITMIVSAQDYIETLPSKNITIWVELDKFVNGKT